MKKIGVLGTGTMGAGIIQVLAQNGYEVVMRARRDSSIEKGLATVKKNLDKMVAKERMTAEEAEAYFPNSDSAYVEFGSKCTNIIETLKKLGILNSERKLMTYDEYDALMNPEVS